MVTMRTWRILLGVFCLACSGCTIPLAQHPLVSPSDAKAVPDLHGVYRAVTKTENDSADAYVHVGSAGDEFPDGFLRIVTVSQPTDGKSKLESTSFVAFVEPVGKYHVLHVPLPKTPDEKPPKTFWDQKWNPDEVGGYFLLRLSSDDKQIEVAGLNANFVAEAIAAKRLDGNVTEKESGGGGVLNIRSKSIEITAQPDELRKFFIDNFEKGLFEKPFMTFRRSDR